jgi:gamma-glutamyltranspeptidase/glutathione hydrolase
MRDFHLPGRSSVFATNGMVATSHPLASKTAIDILQDGGNAVDAAIGAAVLLGLCEPQMTGIGGDCFVLLKQADTEDILALNGSGRAPAALTADQVRAKGNTVMPIDTADAVTIPGAIDAFCRLSDDYGALGLDHVLAPAISYARSGIPVAPRVHFDWKLAEDRLQGDARKYYLIDDKTPNVGQVFRAPNQAVVLEKIAAQGRDGFYKGEVAEDMVSSLNALGGVHTLEDFANTRCDYTQPISGQYKGYDLVEHPPNGQGATALLMNNILSQFDISALDPFGAQRAHIEAEASKLAYDARNRFLADPDHMTKLDHLLSMQTAVDLAALIDPIRAMENPSVTSESVHKETIYITVVDKDRMAVSLIYSVFHSFGSGLASQKFGINFQNRGAGFSLIDGHANCLAGGKRPMHTIIPAMLKHNGRVVMPFGVMGGAYQPNGHARFVSNIVDFGMDPQSAIDAPRSFTDQGVFGVERGYSEDVRLALTNMGHTVSIPEVAIGGAQSIWIDESGVLQGASDPRKDGCALGY